MDVLTEDVREDVAGSIIFADDIVLCGDDKTGMTEYLWTWRRALEDRGMRISRPKTQFIDFQFGEDNGQGRGPVKILGDELQRVHHFKYLGSSVEETGGMTTEISQRVSAAWANWKRCSGVLCDIRMPVKLKPEGEGLQNCGQTSSVVWCRILGDNEGTRSTTRGK